MFKKSAVVEQGTADDDEATKMNYIACWRLLLFSTVSLNVKLFSVTLRTYFFILALASFVVALHIPSLVEIIVWVKGDFCFECVFATPTLHLSTLWIGVIPKGLFQGSVGLWYGLVTRVGLKPVFVFLIQVHFNHTKENILIKLWP